MNSTKLPEIKKAVEKLGYVPLQSAPVAKKRDVWYKRGTDSELINSFLYLSYKPEAQAYSVHAGVVSRDARSNVLAAIERLKEFINPIYLADPFYLARPCWHMFDAGRALNWSSVYVIPDPYDRLNWLERFDELVNDFLAKEIFMVRTEHEIIDLLLRNDAPFEWSLTNPVLRISEVVAMARRAGLTIDQLMSKVELVQKDLARGLYGSKGCSEVTGIIVELLY